MSIISRAMQDTELYCWYVEKKVVFYSVRLFEWSWLGIDRFSWHGSGTSKENPSRESIPCVALLNCKYSLLDNCDCTSKLISETCVL